jgi:hypothetical protein
MYYKNRVDCRDLDGLAIDLEGRLLEWGDMAYYPWVYEVSDKDRYEIMQYTGLKDKNGKEIYEGDILYYESCDDKKEVMWGPILDHDTKMGYGDGWGLVSTDEDAEIIGNIYENPELLEGKE